MRLLQAMAGAEHGGAEQFFGRLAPALARAGVEQRLLVRAHPARNAQLRADGLDVVELPFGGALDIVTPLRFRAELRRFKPQVVLTWMNRATVKCPPGPFVHVGRLGGYYDLKYYRTCRHLVCNTPDIRAYVIGQGWPEERAHYLPNFVSGSRGQPVARQRFFTPRNAPLLLALGRLHVNKAFDVLLRALQRVPDAYLWLAGDGPERASLEALAAQLGVKPRVRFLGWHDDVAPLFASADVFVCPSRHEPLGNVVIEAWAHGLPVVAADALGPGTLVQNMKTGVLAPVDDAPQLAAAIRLVLDDDALAERLVVAGHQRYVADFNEAAVVRQYLAFLEGLVG